MSDHQTERMDIRDVCGILSKAFPHTFQSEIIQNGFKVLSIFPFNENVFSKNKLLALYPTD